MDNPNLQSHTAFCALENMLNGRSKINAKQNGGNIQSFTKDLLGRPSEGMTLIVTASDSEADPATAPDIAKKKLL